MDRQSEKSTARYYEKEVKSALPIWAAAAVWVIAGLFFPIYNVFHIILVLAVSVLVGFAVSKILPKEYKKIEIPYVTGIDDADRAIELLNDTVEHIENCKKLVTDGETSAKFDVIADYALKIREQLLSHPEDVKHLRRFSNYYLPTTVKLTDKYAELAKKESSNIGEIRKSIENELDTIGNTFRAQYDAMFSDDELDISTDIKVLEAMIEKDNLK
ncbi:MAG: 5-bromo-4-chloroindolyl phosphate hydrolysis family protein [Firmicutes bacterium]|nr:5-bromo-4-chloroindolyl phosphate hydrolysis family protein [Candidatus Colimorpha enterica]